MCRGGVCRGVVRLVVCGVVWSWGCMACVGGHGFFIA